MKPNPLNEYNYADLKEYLISASKNAHYKGGAILGAVENNLCIYLGIDPVNKETERLLIKAADALLNENETWAFTPWQRFCADGLTEKEGAA